MPSHVARFALTIAVALALPATASAAPGKSSRPVCPGPAAPGTADCHAKVVTDRSGAAAVTATPAGYGPADLQAAYVLAATPTSPSISATAGAGQTIAIVDAYDAPTAEADLGTYRNQFGLAPCTSANGCFKKVNQNGGTTPPKASGSWAQEISLDLDMASAICPNCKILLVEAASSSLANLGTAVNTAARLNATVISNSYGGPEYSSETADQTTYYNHPGIPITVSSGDSGYGVEFPAASQYVTAVGGTSLTKSASGFSEKAWSGAGSGCSAYVPQPSWQGTAGTGCARRALADVSAVADPNTGVAVYDSTRYQGASGWMVFGGTSVAAPVVAGVYALAGNGSTIDGGYPYSHTASLNDVTSGSNGTCSVSQWCNAGGNWDGPTGLGTPNGIGGF